MQTVIEMLVESTKQTGYETMPGKKQHEIHCNVPYGENNIFFRMSGGSTLTLMTVNDEAAALFTAGKKVKVTIEQID